MANSLVAALSLSALLGSSEPGRLSEGAFNAPSALKSHVDYSFRDSDHIGPLGKASLLSVPLDQAVVTAVSVLLDSGFPSAISGFVVPVIVDPSNTVISGRSGAYVSNEGVERLSPFRADCYSPASVVVKANGASGYASSDHVSPRPVTDFGLDSVVFDHGTSVTTPEGEVK